MKKLLFLFLMCMAVVSVSAQRQYEAVDGDPMKVRIYTLSNGLKVYLSQNKEKPRVAAHITVNTGHRNDPAETTGLAHYLEHLMFKGTSHFGTTDYAAEKPLLDKITQLYEEHYRLTDPEARKQKYQEIDSVSQLAAQYNIPNEYDKLMTSIGSEVTNAYTSFDITNYTEDVPSNELEKWAKIQSDRFQNMVIRGFHTELEAVYEEKNISLSDDGEKMDNALMAKLFPSHSYGTQTTLGTQEHLKNPSIVNILNYYNKYYKPNNIAICMVGDLDFDNTMDIIERYFGSWQPGADIAPRQFPKQPQFTTPQDTSVVGIEEERMVLGWRFNGAADWQNDTLQLVIGILSNGNAGLLDLDLNQKMKVQNAVAGGFYLKDYSLFSIYASPNDGQSLDEVKSLILAEIDKLKKGEFDDDLLTAVINNMKLMYNNIIVDNDTRIISLVDSYIFGQPWQDAVQELDRISKITKQGVMNFAAKYLTDGYVCVYKRQGQDDSVKKIDKPAITPIPSNRDLSSGFFREVSSTSAEPIQPVFVDFKKDLTVTKTKSGLPFIYKHNDANDVFSLTYRFPFGKSADNRYEIAAEYINLVGTNKLTCEQLSKQFYLLACKWGVHVGDEEIEITVSGLGENLAKAVSLLEHTLDKATADADTYKSFVDLTIKDREDAKLSQEYCFRNLWQYAVFGSRNSLTDIMSADELRAANPQVLLDLIRSLSSHQHTVIYFGPATEAEVQALVRKHHKTPKKLLPALENHPYEYQQTPVNEVLLAPYEANNIYFRKYNCSGRQWSVDEAATQALFNEYFDGGMNSIVFQELREARGLAYNSSAFYCSPSKVGNPEYAMEHIISQNDKMGDCISVFADITDHMPQSQSAFQLAQQSIMKSIASQRITRNSVIQSYLEAQKLGIDYSVSKRIYEALPSLSLSDVTRFEQQQMANKPWRFAILGNEKELDMKVLESIGNIKRLSLTDIFGY
ncbi:MAG: insulinase family protein [Prevotellaceae bacterium]|nr:insulinase family protein [Candidatus Minthosoma caballi]